MEYHLKHVKVADVQDEANTVLSELKTDDKLREEARQAGVDLKELDAALAAEPSRTLIQVKPQSEGLGPAAVAVIVAFSPVAAKILRDIWDYLILPRIRGVHGPDAIKPAAPKDGK